MLFDLCKHAEQAALDSDYKSRCKMERRFIVETWISGASVTITLQLAGVSLGTMTKVTPAFRSIVKTSVNRSDTVVDSAQSMYVMLMH